MDNQRKISLKDNTGELHNISTKDAFLTTARQTDPSFVKPEHLYIDWINKKLDNLYHWVANYNASNMLPLHCLIYYFSIVLNCVIKYSCHPWITYTSDLIFFYFSTYGKSVLVNKLNVVNHSHSYIHKKIDLYYSKFTWVSRLFIEICQPIKIPFWILSTNQKFFSHACGCFHTRLKEIEYTSFSLGNKNRSDLSSGFLLTYESICC
jgi:hypothetical protein